MEGAGGVGGLLSTIDFYGTSHSYHYDGNGNVVDLYDEAGASAAHYEYSPYGGRLRATGSMAELNPFRFSTKYTDDETELAYYGNRYYQAGTGRWVNRDPIEEEGGANVYGFVYNQPTQLWGVDGLAPAPTGQNGSKKTTRQPSRTHNANYLPKTKPNSGGYGPIHRGKHSIWICFKNGDLEKYKMQMYYDLRIFRYFSPPNIANVMIDGNRARFTPSNIVFDIGSVFWYGTTDVTLSFDSPSSRVIARTQEGHMLVGTRYWQVSRPNSPCCLQVETGASERSADWVGEEIGRNMLNASKMQSDVWINYLTKIGNNWKANADVVRVSDVVVE